MARRRSSSEKPEGRLWVGPIFEVPPPPSAQAAAGAVPLLEAAQQLVARPRGWTQGAFARAGNGRPAPLTSEKATRFCLTGAVLRAGSERYGFSVGETDEPRNWFELEPFGVPASVQAALWALSYSSLTYIWLTQPLVEVQAYAPPAGKAKSFTRLSEAVNDADWMSAELASLIIGASPAVLRVALEEERRRRRAGQTRRGGEAS